MMQDISLAACVTSFGHSIACYAGCSTIAAVTTDEATMGQSVSS